MPIYVVVSLEGEETRNVFVGTDKDQVLAMKPEDYENSSALFVEIWEDGQQVDEFRLPLADEEQED
ncbi:hypothetical protein MJA45_20610 [Paenibacillus aurantius]|uniref:Uncharacterized protein n=1 Tax=Paenibacillus aurantius TaxID=2918900 RepID=A0AA96LB78_9BACL|nr:hypothetical protein [Paenibacillus aurantius]WJH34788.1 hypothetical protein N6H14_00860 [Paenibacillus sp. CC-CFT747]WNQ10005.1 hypothetical protein MJA45_20610 [Paenibacillus aurantius]